MPIQPHPAGASPCCPHNPTCCCAVGAAPAASWCSAQLARTCGVQSRGAIGWPDAQLASLKPRDLNRGAIPCPAAHSLSSTASDTHCAPWKPFTGQPRTAPLHDPLPVLITTCQLKSRKTAPRPTLSSNCFTGTCRASSRCLRGEALGCSSTAHRCALPSTSAPAQGAQVQVCKRYKLEPRAKRSSLGWCKVWP